MQAIKTRLKEIESHLSPDSLLLWLEFGDFLRQRESQQNTPREQNLLDLAGGLEHSSIFSGDPVEIQEKLRDEWN
jgi:hypothetical protein